MSGLAGACEPQSCPEEARGTPAWESLSAFLQVQLVSVLGCMVSCYLLAALEVVDEYARSSSDTRRGQAREAA